jgi:N utilization substance protein B
MTRHQSRQMAIGLLYSISQMNYSVSEAVNQYEGEVSDDAILFVNEVLANLEEIDSIIEQHLENYTLNRLNQVDKQILRLAVCELLKKTPKGIVINEALNLTREYSDEGNDKAVKFNNKVLDKIAKDI